MGAAANKNNHLKRHAIVRSQGSNIHVMLRDCFVFGLAEGEGSLYPGKNGVHPHEFIVKNGEVGVETRQKEAAAFRIQFGMPVGWNEVAKIFTGNAVITQTQRQLSASAPPQAKKALISVGSASHLGAQWERGSRVCTA